MLYALGLKFLLVTLWLKQQTSVKYASLWQKQQTGVKHAQTAEFAAESLDAGCRPDVVLNMYEG